MKRTNKQKIKFILDYAPDFGSEYMLDDVLDLMSEEQLEKLFNLYSEDYSKAWEYYKENLADEDAEDGCLEEDDD